MKYIQFIIIGLLLVSIGFIAYLKSNDLDFFSVDMVDDVIHDKYEKNSDEYYIFRNIKDEILLEEDEDNMILYDNLAVGYDHLGDYEKAMAIYDEKKRLMDISGGDMQNWYRYYANLGTFLIHHGFNDWFKDKTDEGAKNTIIQGKDYIKEAIEINIQAHFGRENYQLVAITWIISTFDNPGLFMSQNMLGKTALDEELFNQENSWETCGQRYHDLYPEVKKDGKSEKEQILDSCPMALKGVIGMIRFGGGPNPFSFLTIGDILAAMGEYKLSAASYIRSIEMKHPNSKAIEAYTKKIATKIYPELSEQQAYDKLYTQYQKDKTLGTTWSDKYLQFQKDIISKGIDPTDQSSYTDFYKQHKRAPDLKYDR